MNRVYVILNGDDKINLRNLYIKKINIYNIIYGKKTKYLIDIKDLKKIPKYKIKNVEYLYFKKFIYYFKNNINFFIGIFISILIFILSSNIIFKIEIEHDNKDLVNKVSNSINKYNFKAPMFHLSYKDINRLKELIKKDNKDIIDWIEIKRVGMKYKVKLEDRKFSKINKTYSHCDIVSIKDSVITSIINSSGESVVNVNDYVKKGNVLISGDIIFNEKIVKSICASGLVYGNTWYNVSVKVPSYYSYKKYLNKYKYGIDIRYKSNDYNFHIGKIDNYTRYRKKLFKLFNITIYFDKYNKYKIYKNKLSKKDTINKGLNIAREKINKKIGKDGKIIDEKILQTNYYDSIIYMEVFFSTNEKISKVYIKENT